MSFNNNISDTKLLPFIFHSISELFFYQNYILKYVSHALITLFPLTGGVDTGAVDSTYDISNADRIGYSEVELVTFLIDGVQLLIDMEKALEKGKSIDDMIPKEKK